MQRPSGNNADEWNLWLCYWLQGPTQDDAVPSAYLAVQIAEALASARAEGWKAGIEAAKQTAIDATHDHPELVGSWNDACEYIATAILALEERVKVLEAGLSSAISELRECASDYHRDPRALIASLQLLLENTDG